MDMCCFTRVKVVLRVNYARLMNAKGVAHIQCVSWLKIDELQMSNMPYG